jgi:O-antigen/teichoic acid export membrane protein
LGEFASTAIVGNVGVALKFGGVMSLAVDSVGIALLPFFASLTSKQHARHTNRLYNYSVYLMLSIIMPLLATVCVVSWNVTVIIWPTYLLLPYLIPIVSAGVIFTMLASYTATILISKNKVRPLMNYSIIVSVVELVLLVIFVPMFKGIGLAVIASLIAPFLSFILYMRLAEKLIALKLDYNKIGRILVASVITAAIIAPVPFLLRYSSIGTLAVALVLLVVVYPQVVTRLGGLNDKDLTVIKSTSKNMPVVGSVFAALADYGLYCRRGIG